jgi:hypothetical protein
LKYLADTGRPGLASLDERCFEYRAARMRLISALVPFAVAAFASMPRQTLMRGLTVAMIAFALLASISVAVQAKRHPQLALLPIAAMPAVNIP